MKHARCILCGAQLAPDHRWAVIRWLAPRFPRCNPPTEACFRGLARSIGANPTDAQVAVALRSTRR